MSYARRVAYNTIVQIAGRLAGTVLSIVTVSLLNGGLGADGFGIYTAVITYAGFFAVVADLGINLRYLQEISREPERTEALTARFLGFRLATACLLLLISPLIASLLRGYAGLGTYIWIACLSQFFLLINQIFVSTFQSRLSMDRAILTDFLGRLLQLIGIFSVFHFLKGSFVLLFWVIAASNAANMLASYLLARRFCRIRISFEVGVWPRLLADVLPIAALSVLGMIHFKADSLILTQLKPKVDVGIYGNAYKVLEVLIVMPAFFAGGLFPAMAQAVARQDANFRQFVQKAFDLILFAVVPVTALIALFAPYIISILTRANVEQASRSLQILSLALIPLFLGTLVAHALLAAEKQKALSGVELVAAVVNICLNLYLIPRYSYYGAAAATVVSEGLTVTLTLAILRRTLAFLPSAALLKSLVPVGGGMLVLVWLALRYLSLRFFPTYEQLPHLEQGVIASLLMGGAGVVYLLPFLVLRQLPPVVQERVNQLISRRGHPLSA